MTDTSRRALLQLAASTALAWPLTTARAARATSWDLIVVGGGNAGLPAALFAAQRGARVLIVEAAGQVGGTLFLSSGQMSAAGTRLQRERGIVDTPQSHYDDVMRISGGTADAALVRLAVFNAAAAFDWLTDHGFKVRAGHPVTGTTHDPYSHARYAWAERGGLSILAVLNEQLKPELDRGRVQVLTQHEAVELIQGRDGAVRGVVTQDAKGERTRVNGRNVALTCGGYTANPQMFEKLEGVRTYSRATYPYSRGAGIDLALAAGGVIRGGDRHMPLFGAIMSDSTYPATIQALARHFPPDRPPWEILVNVQGQRFVREDVPSHTAQELALGAQPEERCWAVFDAAILAAAPPLITGGINGPWTPADTVDAFATPTPMFHRADSLAALARAAGIEPAGLERSVRDYNRGRQSGIDALGRVHMPLPIERAPFHAVQLQSWNLTSYAGVAVDDRLRVVRTDGAPVPNLYAAGELLGMGQLMGHAVCGGMSVMPALALGRLLGAELVDLRRS